MIDAERPHKSDRRAILSWCLYDWANSAFPTVITTFVFATYYVEVLATDTASGTADWGNALSISGLLIALISPIAGAIADWSGPRKPWLGLFTMVSVCAGATLWFIAPEAKFAITALILVAVANTAFEMGQVFYNAMLPDLASKERLGRVSGWAWALGYFGGLAALTACLLLFIQPEQPLFGLDKEAAEHVRATGPFVALWMAAFAVPLFLFTPDRPRSSLAMGEAARQGLAQLWRTLGKLVRDYKQIGLFLLARMLYIDGLNTLFVFGGIYAAGSFGMSTEEVLLFGILLNVTSGLGAFGFAWIDDWIGPKKTILISIAALTLLGGAILLVQSVTAFYVLGAAIGIFIGPTQSASRSMMAHMAPAEIRTELFGLYAFSGKATAFLGPLLVGQVTLAADSQRVGMAMILVFFVAGALLLMKVKEVRSQQP